MEAKAFRALSEHLTTALVTGDFELYRQVVGLPVRFEPREGKAYTLETVDELQEDFALYHDMMSLHGITDIYREILGIEQPEPQRADVTCLVNYLRKTGRAVDPFRMKMTLREGGDGWRIHLIKSSLGHINWTLGKGGIEDGSFV